MKKETNKLMSVIIENGIQRLITPKGYVLGRITGTRIIHDIDRPEYPLATCFFDGFVGGTKKDKNVVVDSVDFKGPRLNDGSLFSPDGEKLTTTKVVYTENDGILYYSATAMVKLNYDTNHNE